MSAAVACPSLTMKLPCVGETRASPARLAFQPGAIDERAGRRRNVGGHLCRDRDSEKCNPALGVSSGCVFLRYASDWRAHIAKRCRVSRRHAEDGRQQHFAGFLQAASIVAEFHFVAGKIARRSPSRPASRTDSTSSPISRPPKCALPKIAPPTVPGVPPTLPARRCRDGSSSAPGR